MKVSEFFLSAVSILPSPSHIVVLGTCVFSVA